MNWQFVIIVPVYDKKELANLKKNVQNPDVTSLSDVYKNKL